MKMTKGAVGKGCGSYSVSHPKLTTVHNDKGRVQSSPHTSTMGKFGSDESYSGPGMSAKLPRGKSK